MGKKIQVEGHKKKIKKFFFDLRETGYVVGLRMKQTLTMMRALSY